MTPKTAILRVKDKNGKVYDIPAIRGKDGEDGHTPVKGVDYFDGAAGKNGADGVSPTISVGEITGGRRLTITDKNGTKTVDVMDGKDLQGWASVTDDSTTISITPADKTAYRFPNATNVTITCPTNITEYECWIYIGGANASFSIANGTKVGTASKDDYSSTSGIEISIKDGRYVVGFSGVSL